MSSPCVVSVPNYYYPDTKAKQRRKTRKGKKMLGQNLWWTQMQNCQQNIYKPNSITHQKESYQNDYSSWSSWIHPKHTGWFNIHKSTHTAHHISEKPETIISLDAEKAWKKIHHPFVVKVLERTEMQATCHNIINVIYSKPTTNLMSSGEKFQAFPLR